MKRKFLVIILSILTILFSLRSDYLYASNDTLSKSTSLSFIKHFPIVHAKRSFGSSTVSIGINVDSSLTYRGNMILYSKSSYKYAEKGKTTSLRIEVSNFVSSVELNLDTDVSISYGIGSIDVPIKVMKLKYSILDRIGENQEIILGEYLLFSGTIPVLGIQVSLFMRPVIKYTPTLQGGLNIVGPATASPSSLVWNQKSVTSSIRFTDTKPVLISLSNPRLILNDLKVGLEVYAFITAVTVSAPDIELVNLGDYLVSSSSVNLISYDPNYFVLYTELQQSYSELASRLQEIHQSLTTLTTEVNNLKITLTNEINLLNSQIKTNSNQLNNITAKYNEVKNSLTSMSQRLTSLESQINQLITQPRNQQIHMMALYALSIVALIMALLGLIRVYKK